MPQRHGVRFLFLMFAMLFATVAPLAPAIRAAEATPVASPVASDELYVDPAGLFTVPIPENWQAATHDGYGQLTDPEQLINVYFAAIADADLEAALATLWERVYTDPQPMPVDVVEVPGEPDYDRLMFILYDDGITTGRVLNVSAAMVDGTSYLLIYDGERDAVVRRSSQLGIIDSGFDVLAVSEVDLAGVMPRQLTPELLTELDAYVEAAMAKQKVPGAAIAIVQNGEVVYRQGFGVRGLGQPEPVTPETLMMIGSITKPLTTTMMATVVDDGLMSWDTPAQQILPSFAVADPVLSPTITMRNLVCACTGVPRRDLQFIFNASELSPADVISSLASFVFYTPIGEAFQYSNQMVAVGGYLATLAAGGSLDTLSEDYASAMQERVFDPIGMLSTTLSTDVVAASPNHASPHLSGIDGDLAPAPVEVESVLDPITPAGSAWSNVDDLARYMLTMLNRGEAPDGTRVVTAAGLSETWLPQVPTSDESSYGLGWEVTEFHGQPMLTHAGNTTGFTADLAILPEANLGVVVLSNAPVANMFTLSVRDWALELAFDQPHEGEDTVDYLLARQEEQLAFYLAAIGPAPAADDVAPFLGSYTNPDLGGIVLQMDGARLVLDAGEFTGEVRPVRGGLALASTHRVVDGVMLGQLLNLRFDEENVPVFELIDGADQTVYPFTRIDGAATPATPVSPPAASPVATPLP